MGNMSYCRFENTFEDMKDCAENIHEANMSEREKTYRIRFIELCREVAEEFDGVDLEDELP